MIPIPKFLRSLAGLFARKRDRQQLSSDERAALLDRISGHRTRTLGQLQAAIRVTETETLTVGDKLRAIVLESESYVDEIRNNLGGLQATEGAGGVGEILENQCEALDSFTADLESRIAQQDQVAVEAREAAEKIAAEAASITQISTASRLLALNTMVEASRYKAGGAFSVIAHEMQELSDRVAKTNERISKLAESLIPAINRVQQNARSMGQETSAFSDRMSGQREGILEVSHRLHNALANSLESGDTRLASILSQSHAALSHLQFQDPMAQRLLRIDTLALELERALAEELGQELRAVTPPAHTEVGNFHDATDLESGDVMLF